VVGLPFIEFPSAWARSRDEYFDKNLGVHDEFKGEALVSTTLAPHAPYTVADETFARIRVLSDHIDIPVHLHCTKPHRKSRSRASSMACARRRACTRSASSTTT
jgi:cytosine/adenosine deaminase-related metal-dependent hydrolase